MAASFKRWREPKLAEFFSLGKKVTVLFKGKIYHVTG